MGYSISWLAIKGRAKPDIHRELGLSESGKTEEEPDSVILGTDLPDGSYLVFLNECFHRFIVSDEILGRLSQGCEIVGCQVEEHVMVSAAFGWKDGHRLWEVGHEADKGIDNLDVEGAPPAALREIEARLRARQDKYDSENDDVDAIFDIPVELAFACCGYRHDYGQFAWGSPVYAVLEEI